MRVKTSGVIIQDSFTNERSSGLTRDVVVQLVPDLPASLAPVMVVGLVGLPPGRGNLDGSH